MASEEQKELQEAFKLYDKDKDGMLRTKEFSLLMRSIGQSPSQEELKKMCPGGSVGMREFLRLMEERNQGVISEEKLLRALRVFDPDRDGYIEIPAFRKAMTSYGEQISDQEVDEMIQECDVKNNRISLAEFARLMQTN